MKNQKKIIDYSDLILTLFVFFGYFSTNTKFF